MRPQLRAVPAVAGGELQSPAVAGSQLGLMTSQLAARRARNYLTNSLVTDRSRGLAARSRERNGLDCLPLLITRAWIAVTACSRD